MDKLKTIVDEAIGELDETLSANQIKNISTVIEAAVIRGLLEGQHRAVDACVNFKGAEIGRASCRERV